MNSCKQPFSPKSIPPVKTPEHVGTIRKPPSSFSDTLIIRVSAAVFYNPDSIQLQKIKEMVTKNEYESSIHDCYYQMRNARNLIKQSWSGIHIIETSTNRYLVFVKADKTKTVIDLNIIGDTCGIILFDGKKEPELADMMNIDTALGFYFDK
jgi:hypothetical protein